MRFILPLRMKKIFIKKIYDEENKSESDEMKSTNLDSMINEEEKNPSPIIIDIKNSIKMIKIFQKIELEQILIYQIMKTILYNIIWRK